MAELTTKKRNKLPKTKFALPGERKYPIDTPERAANAKARATQEYNAGRISKRTMEMIHSRADKVLGNKK